MSVGFAKFDRDHQHMLLLADEIWTALSEGGQEHARALVDRLLALAGEHIAGEEAFLRRIGFPGVEAILAVQRDSLSRIAALKDAMAGDAQTLLAEMRDAFVTYLLRADINYKSFVEDAGESDTGWRHL
jgi:hemerythrin